MKTIFLILICLGVMITQSASAYHEEREQIEISQMTGIFNSEMDMIHFPLAEQDYRLQIVIRDQSQNENSTLKVGYGFNLMERIPHRLSPDSEKPFLGFDSTHSTSSYHDSKIIQTSQYEFPIIVNFTISFENPGVYRYSFFENRVEPSGGGGGSSGGGYHVVTHYSKAIDNSGKCKNPKLLTLAKYDFSTLVCVTPETHHELITRGWAPLPG